MKGQLLFPLSISLSLLSWGDKGCAEHSYWFGRQSADGVRLSRKLLDFSLPLYIYIFTSISISFIDHSSSGF